MKKKKLAVLFIAAALLLNAIPCYAAQSAPSFKVSVPSASAAADYTSLPTGDTLKEDVGFVPKLIDSFALEYKSIAAKASVSNTPRPKMALKKR